MVVAEMTRGGKEARERGHFPGLHRWFPGSGDERPVWWEILSAHLVLPKNWKEVSKKMRKWVFHGVVSAEASIVPQRSAPRRLSRKNPGTVCGARGFLPSGLMGRFFLRPRAPSGKITFSGRGT